MLLVMTVEPGFGGQAFLDMCLPKIRRARTLIDKHGLDLWLQVDGGVSLETIERCAEAGADTFVAGSAVFGADDPNAMIESLRAAAAGPSQPRPGRAGAGDAAGSSVGRDHDGARAWRPVWQAGPTSEDARVLWGRCNSEPAVKVRDPAAASSRLTRWNSWTDGQSPDGKRTQVSRRPVAPVSRRPESVSTDERAPR